MTYLVSSFYKFFPFHDFAEWKAPLLARMNELDVRGSILLASEGVNGTISGKAKSVAGIISRLESIPGCAPLTCKESTHAEMPFGKAKVKLKKELISMGEYASPLDGVGEYVAPENWNALLAQDDLIVIDARNSYETHVGKFKGAVDPSTRTFKQLAGYSREQLDEWKNKKIATYCTGGIRCEKFTAWLKQHGVNEVYHLKGGILNYLEKVKPEESLFEGSCYVFDERTALAPTLAADHTVTYCPSCGHSLTLVDRRDDTYIPESHCPYCDGYAPSNADYLTTIA